MSVKIDNNEATLSKKLLRRQYVAKTHVDAAAWLQEKRKELRLKEFMEHELENKDKQLENLVARQHEVGHDTSRK